MSYKITRKGESYYQFLGDLSRMTSNEERKEADAKREAMIIADWAKQQILTLLDCGELTKDNVLGCLTYSRDSLVDQSFPTNDAERTKHSIAMFAYGAVHLETLLLELLKDELVTRL